MRNCLPLLSTKNNESLLSHLSSEDVELLSRTMTVVVRPVELGGRIGRAHGVSGLRPGDRKLTKLLNCSGVGRYNVSAEKRPRYKKASLHLASHSLRSRIPTPPNILVSAQKARIVAQAPGLKVSSSLTR